MGSPRNRQAFLLDLGVEVGVGIGGLGRLPVIALADLVGYTRLTETEGDARAVAAAARLQTLADKAAMTHQGRVIKLLGMGR